MAERLADYRRKRDPERTPEPAGEVPKGRGRHRQRRGGDAEPEPGGRFVVHEHHARRLHWDLRLERAGVLASWAVPRGIPPDPAENRKAVRTEDHPIEYLEFEGEIPAGQYGAGRMSIWDRGTYECEKWQERKVMVTFHGERLRGRYALFATGRADAEAASGKDAVAGGPDWMIHRMDPPADPEREPLPEQLVPMLATLGELPAGDGEWAYEIKWDGVRALAYAEPGRLRLVSRNLNDVTSQYPELGALTRALGSHEALLDGEIVAFDEKGRPSFERLQQRMHLASERQVRERRRSTPVTYVAFDLLHLDGRSLLDLPYRERRAQLEELELEGPAWRTPRYHEGDGEAFLGASRERGLEGIMAKRLDSPYRPGRRSRAWIKVKNLQRVELLIGGWVPGEGRRRERVGALLVGRRDGEGGLQYAGRVGTGFTEAELDRLMERLEPLRRDTNPFDGRRGPRKAVWTEPELACEVEFREWTREGLLRAPSYQGLHDGAGPVSSETDTPAEDSPLGAVRRLPGGDFEASVEGRRLKLSNFDKVLYPRTGFTKGQLIEYYARIAPAVLPHLHGRPLTLKRYPNGVESGHFYEKQCPGHRPDWVTTERIQSEREERAIDYCLANDLPTLVWLGNLADLELHPSLSLASNVERPTTLAFDLDPGAPAALVDCCAVALWLRRVLEAVGLEAYPKTSGSKGLQVYVPLNTDVTYADTKPFAKAVAELLEKEHRDRVVSRMAKELRAGKVFVDWSQNDRHKTTVSVYSLRARERPTVSTPVTWDEVEEMLEAGTPETLTFEWDAVLERVADSGDLFAPVLSQVQELPQF